MTATRENQRQAATTNNQPPPAKRRRTNEGSTSQEQGNTKWKPPKELKTIQMSVKSRGKLNSVPRFSDPDLVSSFKRMSRDIGILRHICSLVANHLLSGDSWLLERRAFATRQSPFHTFYQFVWQAVIRYFRQIQNPALPAQRGGFYASLDPNDNEDHRLRGDLFSEVYGFLASHEDHLESVLSWNTNTAPPGAFDIQDEIKLMKTSAVRHVQSFHIRYVSCLEYMIAEILTNTNWKGVRRVASAVKDFVFHPENDDDDDDDDDAARPSLRGLPAKRSTTNVELPDSAGNKAGMQ